jgi:anti-anti-sigma regulatory factor
MLVIDLARVERIDAGGLGVLLGLRESARSNAIMFKLMNATKRVEAILEVTHLLHVSEFCSLPELFCLLHRAASIPSCAGHNSFVEWPQAVPAA